MDSPPAFVCITESLPNIVEYCLILSNPLTDHSFRALIRDMEGFDYTVLAILYAADHPDFTIHAVYAYLNDTIHISPEHIHRSILFCIAEAWALGALDTNVRPKVEDFLRAAADWLLAAEEKYEKQQ